MKIIWCILKKEFIDNLRDKRSLFFSLLYGPILMPLMVMGPFVMGAKKNAINFEQPKAVHVVGIEQAPNLMAFLYANNLDAKAAPENYQEAIQQEDIQVVLVLPANYAEQFRSGKSVQLDIYYNKDVDRSARLERQLSNTLRQYSKQLRQLRLAVRGIDDALLDPFDLVHYNLAKEESKGLVMGRLYMFVIVISMMMGGFYLAVDTGAGERERQSLEPLMSLPVSRIQIVLGKLLALMSFVFIATALPVIACFVILTFLPQEFVSSLMDASFFTVLKVFLLVLPLVCLLPAFLLFIGSYASNTKEAQTHLGIAMIIPMLPFFALQFWTFDLDPLIMLIPVLSQFVLVGQAVAGETIEHVYLISSLTGTLGLAVLMVVGSVRLYLRDKLLS